MCMGILTKSVEIWKFKSLKMRVETADIIDIDTMQIPGIIDTDKLPECIGGIHQLLL